MTSGEFLALFPEFGSTDSALVAAKLAEIEATVADTFQTDELREQYVGYATAHALHINPKGRPARLDKSGKSPYTMQLERLQRIHACAHLRSG